MNRYAYGRMRRNLLRGVLALAVGWAAVMLVDAVWDAKMAPPPASAGAMELADAAYGRQAISDFVIGGNDAALGTSELPAAFTSECLSAASLGEARWSEEGSVAGIVSDMDGQTLFDTCRDGLVSHGWLAVDSGMKTRSSFVKDAGEYRWLYLDVSEIGDVSTAVISVRGNE